MQVEMKMDNSEPQSFEEPCFPQLHELLPTALRANTRSIVWF